MLSLPVHSYRQVKRVKGSSHRACDRSAISARLRKLTNAKRLQTSKVRFYWSSSGRRSKLVTSSLLSMHIRLATTDFDQRLVAIKNVFLEVADRIILVTDWFHCAAILYFFGHNIYLSTCSRSREGKTS